MCQHNSDRLYDSTDLDSTDAGGGGGDDLVHSQFVRESMFFLNHCPSYLSGCTYYVAMKAVQTGQLSCLFLFVCLFNKCFTELDFLFVNV